MRTIALFADYFGARFGGINTFNLGLVELLSTYADLKVICIVPTAACIDNSAVSQNFKVLSLRPDGVRDFNGAADADIACKILAPFSESLTLIGHDIKTGSFSNLCGETLIHAFKAVVCHMAYSSYYALMGSSDKVLEKNNQQLSVFRNAHHVLAVGPKLLRHVQDFQRMGGVGEASQLIPPLLPRSLAAMRNSPRITFIGRIEASNDAVKQTTLALRAIGAALKQSDSELRDATVQIIGAEDSSDEARVRELINSEAGASIPVTYSKYVDSRDVSLDMIRDSSLLLMPSIHEGFGLVAWEGMCQGVPVIVSTNSGIFELMTELGLSNYLGGIKVQGSPNGGANDEDVDVLARLIRANLLAPYEAHKKAELLISKIKEHPVVKQRLEDFITLVRGSRNDKARGLNSVPPAKENLVPSLRFSHDIKQNEFGQNVSVFKLLSSRSDVKTALMGCRFTAEKIKIDFSSKYLSTLEGMTQDSNIEPNLSRQASFTLVRDRKLIEGEFRIIEKLVNAMAEEDFIEFSSFGSDDLEVRSDAFLSFVECLNWTMHRSGKKFDAISPAGEYHFSFYLSEEACIKLPFSANKFSLFDGRVLGDFLGCAYGDVLGQFVFRQFKSLRAEGGEPRKINNPWDWRVGPG